MSYIRCLSNPENLYIISTSGGEDNKGVAVFFLDEGSVYMPVGVFENLLRKYVRTDCEEGSTEGKEVYKYEKAMLRYLACPEQKEIFNKDAKDWKWFLQYEGWAQPIEMWEVTLHHIALRFELEYERELFLEKIDGWLEIVGNRQMVELFKTRGWEIPDTREP